jgi:hypothetical protein
VDYFDINSEGKKFMKFLSSYFESFCKETVEEVLLLLGQYRMNILDVKSGQVKKVLEHRTWKLPFGE